MNPFYCNLCGKKIEKWLRLDARFCTAYCRKKYYDIKNGRTSIKSNLKGIVGVVNK